MFDCLVQRINKTNINVTGETKLKLILGLMQQERMECEEIG